jgi:peptidoglycan/LPS O-acetylase OafA/YrhL
MLHGSTPPRTTRAAAADLVVFVCAASAGIHAGLVPEHLREEPRLGIAFALTVVLLIATGAAVALAPLDRRIAQAAALLLAGLVAAYAASRTTGIPVLNPEPEPVDSVGIAAVALELAGLALALRLGQPRDRRLRRRAALKEVTR